MCLVPCDAMARWHVRLLALFVQLMIEAALDKGVAVDAEAYADLQTACPSSRSSYDMARE